MASWLVGSGQLASDTASQFTPFGVSSFGMLNITLYTKGVHRKAGLIVQAVPHFTTFGASHFSMV